MRAQRKKMLARNQLPTLSSYDCGNRQSKMGDTCVYDEQRYHELETQMARGFHGMYS